MFHQSTLSILNLPGGFGDGFDWAHVLPPGSPPHLWSASDSKLRLPAPVLHLAPNSKTIKEKWQ